MSKIAWLGIPMLCPIGVEYGRSEWPGRETKITHKLCLVVGVPWPSHTSGGGRRVNLAQKLWRLHVSHSFPAMKVCPKRMKQRRVSFAPLCFRLQTMWSLQRVGKISSYQGILSSWSGSQYTLSFAWFAWEAFFFFNDKSDPCSVDENKWTFQGDRCLALSLIKVKTATQREWEVTLVSFKKIISKPNSWSNRRTILSRLNTTIFSRWVK
jgi:hypothetical protein